MPHYWSVGVCYFLNGNFEWKLTTANSISLTLALRLALQSVEVVQGLVTYVLAGSTRLAELVAVLVQVADPATATLDAGQRQVRIRRHPQQVREERRQNDRPDHLWRLALDVRTPSGFAPHLRSTVETNANHLWRYSGNRCDGEADNFGNDGRLLDCPTTSRSAHTYVACTYLACLSHLGHNRWRGAWLSASSPIT